MSSPALLMAAVSPTPESAIAVGTVLTAAMRKTAVMITMAMMIVIIVTMVTSDEGDCSNDNNSNDDSDNDDGSYK